MELSTVVWNSVCFVRNSVCFVMMVSSDAVSVSEITSTLYLVMASGLSKVAGNIGVGSSSVVSSGLGVGSRLNHSR